MMQDQRKEYISQAYKTELALSSSQFSTASVFAMSEACDSCGLVYPDRDLLATV
jgi:hypothetical protein